MIIIRRAVLLKFQYPIRTKNFSRTIDLFFLQEFLRSKSAVKVVVVI